MGERWRPSGVYLSKGTEAFLTSFWVHFLVPGVCTPQQFTPSLRSRTNHIMMVIEETGEHLLCTLRDDAHLKYGLSVDQDTPGLCSSGVYSLAKESINKQKITRCRYYSCHVYSLQVFLPVFSLLISGYFSRDNT